MVDVHLRVLRPQRPRRPLREAEPRHLRRRDRRRRRRGLPGPRRPGHAHCARGPARRLAEPRRREHHRLAQRRRRRRRLLALHRRGQGAAARERPVLGLGRRQAVRGPTVRAPRERPDVQPRRPQGRRDRRAGRGLHPRPVPRRPRRPEGEGDDGAVHRRGRFHQHRGALRGGPAGHRRQGGLGEDRGRPLRLERSGGADRPQHLRTPH